MKKIAVLLVVFAILFVVCACAGNDHSEEPAANGDSEKGTTAGSNERITDGESVQGSGTESLHPENDSHWTDNY